MSCLLESVQETNSETNENFYVFALGPYRQPRFRTFVPMKVEDQTYVRKRRGKERNKETKGKERVKKWENKRKET